MVIYYVTNRNISVDPDTEAGGIKMKRIGLLFMVLLLTSVFMVPPAQAREAEDFIPSLDGDITGAPTYTRDAVDTKLQFDDGILGSSRTFLEFDTSTLPVAAIITSVTLRIKTQVINGAPVARFEEMTVQPSTQADNAAGNQAIYDNIGANTEYDTQVLNDETWYTVDLGADAITDLLSHLTWFSVGIDSNTASNFIYSSESVGKEPYLSVTWHLASDYEFDFTDSYFENGTITTGVIVTASDSFSENFNNSGGLTQYYPSMPSHFTWNIGGGITRTVHVVDEENITVTLPDGTDYIYTFTIKDYTGKTSIGQSYLEAWRIVNGVDTVIERMPIQQPNTIPLNLVYGKTYRLRILYADGSRYDWGYFVAGATSSLTLTIRATAFTDQVQIIYNDIFVEATRTTTGLNITVNYNDTRTNTIWANVTIRVRGGAVVVTQDYAIDSFTLDWDLANASLGYVVTVQGLHDDYGTWGYSRIFDQSETFADAPDLTGIFDFGLTGDVGAWVISFLVLLTFSKAMKARAVIAMVSMLTLLRYIGWSTAPWTYFYGYWLIAILISAGTGGGE